MPGLFDNVRDFFSNLFGNDDDDDDDFSWGGVGGDSDTTWGGDLQDEGFSVDITGLEERIIDNPGDEYVQEFYDIDALIDYLQGTPETVLKFYIDTEEEIYYVYRYDSE